MILNFPKQNDISQDEVYYYICADSLHLDVLNSLIQTVIRIDSPEPRYKVLICLNNNKLPKKLYKISAKYTDSVKPYLDATEKIEVNSKIIINLANKLYPENGNIKNYIDNSLNWTYSNISYDNELARQIAQGTIDTRSAVETIRTGKGTCSECVNVFIALSRAKNIPARFINGFKYGMGYHAWAEIYLHKYNWFPVDPQAGQFGITNNHIMLSAGVDFPSLGTKLKDINLDIEKINSQL